MPKFLESLMSGLPIIGSFASGLLQRKWAKQDLERQNLYNSPAEQIKRNAAAGLPGAAFWAGGASQQSDQPRASQLDPTLGGSQVFEKYAVNRVQKQQMDVQQQQLELLKAQTDKTWSEANVQRGIERYLNTQPEGQGFESSKLFQQQEARLNKEIADAGLAGIVKDLQEKYGHQQHDADLKIKAADLEKIILQNQDLNQVIEDQGMTLAWRKTLQERLKGYDSFSIKDLFKNNVGILRDILAAAAMGAIKIKR